MAHIGHTQPTNNAVRRDASPLECSGVFTTGCLVDDDGMAVIRGRLAPEVGAAVLRALDAASEQLRAEAADAPEEDALGHGAAAAAELAYEWRNRLVRDWRIIWPSTPPTNETKWSFRGFLSGFQPSAPMGDKLTASLTIRVASAPTLA